jgi:hypothetical protein
MPYQGSGIRAVPLREIARKGKNPRYLLPSARPDYRRTRKHEIFLKYIQAGEPGDDSIEHLTAK